MAGVSIGTAVGDAFALIRARPAAVFVWGLLRILPAMLALSLMLPAMDAAFADMAAAEPGDVAPRTFLLQWIQMQASLLLLNLLQAGLGLIIVAAVMRAVLQPRARSWFSMRLGMDELRLLVVGIAVFAGLYVLLMMVMILGVATTIGLWSGGDHNAGWAVLSMIGYGVVALVIVVLAMARVSLIAPATLARGDFAFGEGWRAAKGRVGVLAGLMAVLFLITLLLETALVAVGLAAVALTGWRGWAAETSWATPFGALEAFARDHWPWFVAGGVAAAFLTGMFAVLWIAPWASAWRQLQPVEAGN